MQELRLQSAMEYMITYGWVVIMIAIGLAALYAFGVFTTPSVTPATCNFSGDFDCLNAQLAMNGNLIVNLQASGFINVTAIGCNTNSSTEHMVVVSPATYIPAGSNATFTLQCWGGDNIWTTQQVDTLFSGYITLNYTDVSSGFPHTTQGSLTAKASGRST